MTESRYESPESASNEKAEADFAQVESADAPAMSSFIKSFRQLGMTSEKYIVEEKLAEGGMGVIYKVSDRGLRRHAALKVIVPELLKEPALLESFIQEARITGQLEHPNIIPVHDIGVMEDERPFFSMKLMQGETLIEIIRKLHAQDPVYEETYSLFKLLTICRKVCDAVAFAHAKNYIHRDIKPDNIMVGDYGEVLLLDWGLARQERQSDPAPAVHADVPQGHDSLTAEPNLTQIGEVKGTPSYMSPEQAMGIADMIDKRTDIFLLGATLYTVATLNMPYTGRDTYAILEQAERGRFIPPQRRAPQRHIPDALNHIIMKCMAHDREDRYPSVEVLIQDLDAFMAGETVTKHRRFDKGAVLMREGEEGREAYVILSGAVAVSTTLAGQSVSLMQLGPGDTVGEMALISDAPRSATVTAQADTEVVVITADLMHQALEKLPPWMGQIVQALTDRLREANKHIHPLMQGDCTWHALQQLRMIYPIYAKELVGNGESQPSVMALPCQETIADIARNLCLDLSVIARMLQCLCQHGMLRMLDPSHFTIPNYDRFCQFVEFAREQIGHPAHLRTESQDLLRNEENPHASFQALKHAIERAIAELAPGATP